MARRYALPRRAFEDLVDGVQMDLEHQRYATFDDLREYCWRVASTVGLICLNIFGCRHPGGRDYAMHLGLALQLTNITRDVATDLARGRIYLPQDEMARTGCSEADLRAGRVTPEVKALLALQCARARHFYDLAAAALPPGEARHLVAAEIMGAIYFAILQRIEGRGYDVFTEVVRVPRPQRALIAASTWLRTLDAGGRRGGGAGTHLVTAADVVVVGAGCAGLSAATALSQAGASVLVVEARPVPGGRTFATRDQVSGDWVDNGQHVLLGCYHETLAFARRIGAAAAAVDAKRTLGADGRPGRKDERAALSAVAGAVAPGRRRARLVGAVVA